MVLASLGMAVGGYLGGFLFDLSGSYQPVWLLSLVAGIVTALWRDGTCGPSVVRLAGTPTTEGSPRRGKKGPGDRQEAVMQSEICEIPSGIGYSRLPPGHLPSPGCSGFSNNRHTTVNRVWKVCQDRS
jgi:hypothetical protein